jgi:hypothetical protein
LTDAVRRMGKRMKRPPSLQRGTGAGKAKDKVERRATWQWLQVEEENARRVKASLGKE